MFNTSYFKENEGAVVIEFMKRHPFAMLTGCSGLEPVATQVPLLFEKRGEKLFLLGHMMRRQDHQLAFEINPQVLAVFTGPNCYVSATWYSDPNQASTWNYMSVHARGSLRFLDEKGLEAVMQRLTLHFENGEASSSTVFENLPQSYRARLTKSIIAFEIEVNSIDNVFKLSQNRDKESYDRIVGQLRQRDHDAQLIANEMVRRRDCLF